MRAAIYIRVSTPEQARKGLSLPDQKAALTEYAIKHNMEITGLYVDAGVSARKPYKKRPALLRMLESCKKNEIDIILFLRLDRWFRNVSGYYAVQDVLDAHNVSWRAIEEDYETQTSSGRLKVNIMLAVAQDEADRDSDRIKFTIEAKKARGEPTSGKIPYGYMIGPDKNFAIDPVAEPVVKAIFEKYQLYGSVQQVMDEIHLEYGTVLTYRRLDNVLRNTAFYGRYYDQDNICPPYISKNTYDLIQSMRYRSVRKTAQNRVYIFAGLLTCGECGGRMASKSANKEKFYPYYQCPGHFTRRNGCPNNKSTSERKIEAALLDTLEINLEKAKEKERIRQEETPRKSYTREIAALQNKLRRLKDLYLNELMSIEEYRTDQQSILEKIAKYKELEMQTPTVDFKAIDDIVNSSFREVYGASTREDKKTFWRSFIKEIRVYHDGRIEYDFLL